MLLGLMNPIRANGDHPMAARGTAIEGPRLAVEFLVVGTRLEIPHGLILEDVGKAALGLHDHRCA